MKKKDEVIKKVEKRRGRGLFFFIDWQYQQDNHVHNRKYLHTFFFMYL